MDLAGPGERLDDTGGRLARQGLEQRRRLRPERTLRLVGSERLHEPGRLDQRVVRDPRHRGVPAATEHAEPERSAHLLGR